MLDQRRDVRDGMVKTSHGALTFACFDIDAREMGGGERNCSLLLRTCTFLWARFLSFLRLDSTGRKTKFDDEENRTQRPIQAEIERVRYLHRDRESLCSSVGPMLSGRLSNSSVGHPWRSDISRTRSPSHCPVSPRSFSNQDRRPEESPFEPISRLRPSVTFRPRTTATPPFSCSFSVLGSV